MTFLTKKLFIFCGIILIALGIYFTMTELAKALDTGALSPGTMADDATVGTVIWTNPDNTKISDNSYATANAEDIYISHYLKATNFGFSVPAGMIINGILIEIEKSRTVGQVKDDAIKIVKADGSIGATNKADTVTVWPITDSYISYGSSSDLWGESWTPADINDIDFGVVVSISSSAGFPSTPKIDHIRITVYYTAGGEPAVASSLPQIISFE